MNSLKIQSAINLDISFQSLYNILDNLDLLDIHFQIEKYILKNDNYIINQPPPFYKLICLIIIKPQLLLLSKLINFYSNPEKILLSFISFSKDKTIPQFFYNININTQKKFIHQFTPEFLLTIQNNSPIQIYSQLIDNYKKPIIQFLSDNTDPFYFCQLISFLQNDNIIDEIKNCQFSDAIIAEVKKNLKTATKYNHIYLIFASIALINFPDFITSIFLQQNNQTKYNVCPHLPISSINNLIQHLFFINLKNFDTSWITFSNPQKEIIIPYLKHKSNLINKILLSYNIKTIARKYETIKKTITICTLISKSISPSNYFKISEKALQNFYKSGAISFIERNQYIIQ